ncbi:Zinc finger protein 717 [Galemys pyrenaicus]|uniref:Zinc finger protein 717 n=1 Tax=Galemys pyrenaicus TaxID=202257 RepID=A0A8J5ZXH9_GALPY|nr:Zinc finger protein 717 [Galemys pyrenaicus]
MSRTDGPEMRTDVPSQGMMSFEEVTVNFTWEEWQDLNDAQRTLHWIMMLETYFPGVTRPTLLFFTENCVKDPEASMRLEQGAQPWTVEEPPSQKLSGESVLAWQQAGEEAGTMAVLLATLRYFSHVQT